MNKFTLYLILTKRTHSLYLFILTKKSC